MNRLWFGLALYGTVCEREQRARALVGTEARRAETGRSQR